MRIGKSSVNAPIADAWKVEGVLEVPCAREALSICEHPAFTRSSPYRFAVRRRT